MKEWHTPADIAGLGLPDLPTTVRGVNALAARDGWQARTNGAGEPLAAKRRERGGGWQYHFSLFPLRAQQRLVANSLAEKQAQQANGKSIPQARNNGELWDWFERLPDKRKATARGRLDAIEAVEALQSGGINKNLAVAEVSRQKGVGASTLYTWFDLIAGVGRADRLPALAPRHAGRTTTAECDPRAWEALKTDFLRNERPSFTTCYERVQSVAQANGWQVPAPRTLERRLFAEVPAPVMVLARDGVEALKRMYPAQERDRTMFHALEAVNADGHKWDVFVRWPDGEIGRPCTVAFQDLYSNKMLAWRTDKTENADTVRLAFGDVVQRFGVPDLAWLDNGRGFASKWITGGQPNRYRFKVKPEEPSGILTQLGVDVHWTKPYSGQSKPIERAFKDFCDAIAKHPAFAGAYTGNKPDAKPENYGSKAIPLETFLRVVEQGIRLHNARPKRNTRVCGRVKSFDQAFEESLARSVITRPRREQLRLFLLAAESVRADRQSGAVKLLGNRYWSELLHDHRGHRLTLRFDPDSLHAGVHVYRLDGSYIGFAECQEAAGFADTKAGREHNRKRGAFVKANRQALELQSQLSLDDLVKLLPSIDESDPPAPAATRLFNGNLAAAPQPDAEPDEAADAAFFRDFSAGLTLVQGGRED